LQALVTLNDTVYLDIARRFAHRLDSLEPGRPERQIAAGYRLMLYKEMSPEKLGILMGLYRESLKHYTQAPGDAGKMLGLTGRNGRKRGSAGEAALVVVCNALLNLDEVITKN
jgi:hypothetical protein